MRGTTWSKEELKEVFKIYGQCKTRIHEFNPTIVSLAKKLGRGVRSVEAQLTMFRALERADQGEGYSRNRMSRYCLEIWKEGKMRSNDRENDVSSLRIEENKTEPSKYGPIMDGTSINNQFLVKLLDLQQDGSGAISSPKDWANPPLLEVPTTQDEVVERIKETTTRSGKGSGEWLCWVGSPGNGKSASIGKYYRHLSEDYSFKFRKGGNLFDIVNLGPNEIPYRIEVSKKGEKHALCWIIQDASALRDKFCEQAEPARDLVEELKEAYNKGVSLIICANRGVLEAAHNLLISEDKYKKGKWKQILKVIKAFYSGNSISEFNIGEDNPRAPFREVAIRTRALDNSSLLINSSAFNDLINNAVDRKNWSVCDSCLVAGYCPWKLNRDTLADNDGRESTLQILRQVEAFDGQVIVFRGALAFLSYLLAGCPRDYINNETPCEWAQRQFDSRDFFSLLSRRIYMQFFSSSTPDGLEPKGKRQENQLKVIKEAVERAGDLNESVKATLQKVLNRTGRVSTNVGVQWMLGSNGLLSRLDPLLAPWNKDMLDSWGGETASLTRGQGPFVTKLEKVCGEALEAFEDSIESGDSKNKQELYSELRRWISSITLRLGGFKAVNTAWASELNDFIEILKISQTPPGQRSTEAFQILAHFEEKLNKAFDPTPNDGFVPANANFEISNIGDDLKPRVEDDQGENILLSVKLGKEKALLSGELVIALSSIGESGLLRQSAPEETMMKIVDIRDRAAASVDYAFKKEMKIRVQGEKAELHRRENTVAIVNKQ